MLEPNVRRQSMQIAGFGVAYAVATAFTHNSYYQLIIAVVPVWAVMGLDRPLLGGAVVAPVAHGKQVDLAGPNPGPVCRCGQQHGGQNGDRPRHLHRVDHVSDVGIVVVS